MEGPFAPEAKVSVAQRIARGREDVLQTAPGQGGAGQGGAGEAGGDGRVSRIYSDVLADAAKLLRGQTAEFLRRQNRIYQEVSDLSGSGPWPGRGALDALKLTPAQRGQVDQLLARRAEQLKAVAAPPPPERPAPADPGDPAARSLRRREIAFQARAALRAVLTPEQQAAWDASTP